jgi:excinuclease ABC subunit A
LVVEHDKDMILEADHVIDMGPAAGVHGGEIVAEGTPAELMAKHTLTTSYINGEREIAIPKKRREGNGKTLALKKLPGITLKRYRLISRWVN